ncbi:alcohol dehydrogenase catalytic domain-containing protein [Puia sp. P3]|uniref:alcohol dehydrogenase catalytic domain-containing protein n=1 Tax=Puia sp. P3 TaxID=3423952 RepID=UPI003D66FAE3
MKAMILKSPGGTENLAIEDIAVPAIGDNEVLVKVSAISINPVETKLRQNAYFLNLVLHLQDGEAPVILGWDISGVVEATGRSVTRLRKGDEVFGMVNFTGHGKAYAEYVAAREDHLAIKPRAVTHQEAAAATLAALTAWQTLVHYAGVKAGDRVLIHSAAGESGILRCRSPDIWAPM